MRKNKYSVGQKVEFKHYPSGRANNPSIDVGIISEVVNNQYGIEGRTVYKTMFILPRYKISSLKVLQIIKEAKLINAFAEEVFDEDIIRVLETNDRARIKYPSNLKELDNMTPEQAMEILEKNLLTLIRGTEIIGRLTGLGDIYGRMLVMKPIQSSIYVNSSRRTVKSVDEMLKIVEEMYSTCYKGGCMIQMDTERNNENGKIILRLSCDNIKPNKRFSLHVHCNYDGKYNVIYTEGKSIRGR